MRTALQELIERRQHTRERRADMVLIGTALTVMAVLAAGKMVRTYCNVSDAPRHEAHQVVPLEPAPEDSAQPLQQPAKGALAPLGSSPQGAPHHE